MFFAFCATCGAIAVIGLTSHFLFGVLFAPLNPGAIRSISWIFLSGWWVSVACLLIHYAGEISAKYRDLKGRGWSDLSW